jgi:hypothetical protein
MNGTTRYILAGFVAALLTAPLAANAKFQKQ